LHEVIVVVTILDDDGRLNKNSKNNKIDKKRLNKKQKLSHCNSHSRDSLSDDEEKENEKEENNHKIKKNQSNEFFPSSSSSAKVTQEEGEKEDHHSNQNKDSSLSSRDLQFSRMHCIAKFLHAKLGECFLSQTSRSCLLFYELDSKGFCDCEFDRSTERCEISSDYLLATLQSNSIGKINEFFCLFSLYFFIVSTFLSFLSVSSLSPLS
jgi:flagellar biosynthesis GTPase FlhF